ncbi:hypothetical protein psal_cds_298 [Pandoravirus salinus]|uniref:Uncharacterized protein n=1 Tax=Pandoravirus salinus TaxID=1349410 RepID=A0A291ATJ4_9VIRU|nr:hypothetical protein psal_cds_298 [Pandoravirus salinus]ATE82155.1 hypothetical protein psal_cds_298 [Pandoravirus salinus]
MNAASADPSATCQTSLKGPRDAPCASSPMLIDLSSDDEGDLVVGSHARPTARTETGACAPSPSASSRHIARTERAIVVDDSDEEDGDGDEDEIDDADDDSNDPDDNGSDLDDFIVSDDDDDDDDDDDVGNGAPKRSAMTDDQDSEAEFVPSDDADDDDMVSSRATHDASSSPVVTVASDDDDSADDDDGDDGDSDDNGDNPCRSATVVATTEADDDDGARPAKRARLDETEALSVDPDNIVSGKRCRRTTERYVDRRFMKFMVRDVPPNEIDAVFDDEDEYFRSGISLTDSSEEDDDDDGDGAEDLDSSDYEDMDALSSSSSSATRARRRRRSHDNGDDENKSASGSVASVVGVPPERARLAVAGGAPADLSRPPSTVAALLRSLAAQPGGIRPSVASPRSAPTSRARPPP